MTLDHLNEFDCTVFVAALGEIFEHSPWVAEAVYDFRPFADVDALHAAMVAAVDAAPVERQYALIRAHPQLAGKAAIAGALTEASTREQKGAGLDQCTPEEYARLHALNAAYEEKFGFPFIIAVRGHTRGSIIDAMEQRLASDPMTEHREALRQIARIARLRLGDKITG
jgi:2-oxo-4-hydroxy-4-carboxy-5-ureidoimidazoline decarboxylase